MSTESVAGTGRTYEIRALTSETWDVFADLNERMGGLFGGCWCVAFHAEREDHVPGPEGNRAFKKTMVEEGIAHAALVMDGEQAVAWAEYGTPVELPDIHHRKQYDAEKDTDPDYRVTCIRVDKARRREGLAEVALRGALELIAAAGGGTVEGYPHDLTHVTKKTSSSWLYNGTRSMYERVGFAYDRPKGMKNCVMSIEVPPAR
ncbi:GNAT family N-acetyltransferase [Nocardioides hwasunensis]|uniref:GNAT family N-acetyltransferase n=1 Tax=Nocardioides hwasunensis TaxID=397258 RepID=A0ABR8MKU1_9ACTN|nr:GNAT family N-acetyltransferase [Nocardioides hwasunensis]MBD3915134.1 GNAT family N-acetyltransferase [Nocardioides hwasunensis]